MARYRIREGKPAVTIEVCDVGAKKEEFLEAFGNCQDGHCSCPTDEYRKLASIEVQDSGDAIVVRLEAKPGEKLDIGQLETCLDYTTEQMR